MMQKIQFLNSIIWLLTALTIVSCDPYGGYEYWIDNQSDSAIFVTYSEYSDDTLKTIELNKGNTVLLAQYSTHSGLYDEGSDFLNWFDSLGIFTDTLTNAEIKKDYLNRNSWEYDQEVTGMMGKAGDNIYKLTITNEDLK